MPSSASPFFIVMKTGTFVPSFDVANTSRVSYARGIEVLELGRLEIAVLLPRRGVVAERRRRIERRRERVEELRRVVARAQARRACRRPAAPVVRAGLPSSAKTCTLDFTSSR